MEFKNLLNFRCSLITSQLFLIHGSFLHSSIHTIYIVLSTSRSSKFLDSNPHFSVSADASKQLNSVTPQTPSTSPATCKWFWEDDAKSFSPYPLHISDALTVEYTKNPSGVCSCKIDGKLYSYKRCTAEGVQRLCPTADVSSVWKRRWDSFIQEQQEKYDILVEYQCSQQTAKKQLEQSASTLVTFLVYGSDKIAIRMVKQQILSKSEKESDCQKLNWNTYSRG